MGSSQSVVTALETVLKQRDIKIGGGTLKNFVKEVERVAPWFACSGSFTIASWNKLGKDLDRKLAEEDLRLGTKAIWKLVKNCLKDETCKAAVVEGQATLEVVRESLSETERSERLGARKKKDVLRKKRCPPGKSADKGALKFSDSSTSSSTHKPGGGASLYPVKELEALNLDSSESSENKTLDSEEEAELDEEERYYPNECRGSNRSLLARPPPTAPPPYETRSRAFSLVPERVRRKLSMTFPIFETPEGGRVHAPVEYNQIKELAESVRKYGVTANFTLTQLDRLAMTALTPADWQMIAKAALASMGQYMEWKALWYEAAQTQARANATALIPEQQEWTNSG